MSSESKLRLVGILATVVVFLLATIPVYAMPPNEAALLRAYIKQGKIPASATSAEKQRLLRSFLLQKGISAKSTDPGNPLAMRKTSSKDTKGAGFYGPGFQLNRTKYYNTLVILVEFGSDEYGNGPAHNQIPPPNPEDNTSFWIPDFSREHYQQLLFSRKPGVKSLANYYYEQSGGAYSVTGYVTDWVMVPHSEAYYGRDGEDNDDANGPVWRIVVDAVQQLGDSLNWDQFDKEDPYDLDGDGNYDEPDGYIDHVMIIHAGVGQEAGGGAQGDDAIWSHSWWVDFGSGEGPYGLGGVRCGSSDKWIGPYTIQPEDGQVGVFAHEFGHDLGLPDVYDTLYTGEESAGFWTLMSSGSWLGDKGKALGTSPSSMGIWEKYVLGYINPTVVDFGSKRFVTIFRANYKGANNKAVRINLPRYTYKVDINQPYSGQYEWWSGDGNMIDNLLTLNQEIDLTGASQAKLEFWAWYDIEKDWDYAYVEVYANNQWQSIPGNITTDYNPNGKNLGNGITGLSNGWVKAEFDLSSFVGQKIKIRFRYQTDQNVSLSGMTIDDIAVYVDSNLLFFDDVESGDSNFVSEGWSIINGSYERMANHYYMLEYRTATGFDTSMKNWYNFVDYGLNKAEFFEANPGVLLWYRNTRYSDNWVGLHPWAGFLLLVDSHPMLITATGSNDLNPYNVEVPFRTRIQLFDAAFSIRSAKEQTITSWYGLIYPTVLPSLPPVKVFDDSKTYVDTTYYDLAVENGDADFYWNFVTQAMNSVFTPHYGVKWYLRGLDDQKAYIYIDAAAK
jgi:immune inhibitor A